MGFWAQLTGRKPRCGKRLNAPRAAAMQATEGPRTAMPRRRVRVQRRRRMALCGSDRPWRRPVLGQKRNSSGSP